MRVPFQYSMVFGVLSGLAMTTQGLAETLNFTYPYTITYFPGTAQASVQNLTANGTVFIPEGVPVEELRGVIVLSNGSGADERRTLHQEWLQNFARVQKFAAIASGYDQRPINSASSGAESLANFNNFLSAAAMASGCDVINSAPLVWMGMSYGGIESAHGARFFAAKTLGFASQKGYNWNNGSNPDLPSNNETLSAAEQNVVGAFLPGERDTNNSVHPARIQNGLSLLYPGNPLYAGQGFLGWRSGGGRVAFAMDAATGHNDIANQGYDFSLALMAEAIRLRHPGSVGQPLLNIPFNSGYLAERVEFGEPAGSSQLAPVTLRPTFPKVFPASSYAGVNAASSASWLPSSAAALAYQAFTSTSASYANRTETPRQNPVQIETPARFQNFVAGDSTVITVDTREWTSATKVEFYLDGNKLGEKTDGDWSWPLNQLTEGAHTIVVVATNAASEQLAAFSTFTVQSVPAPTLTWTGAAGSSSAVLDANWSGGPAPLDAPAFLAFDGAAANNQYTVGHSGFSADPRAWGLVFKASGGGAFTLNGWRRWELGFGGITNLDAATQTFTSLFRLRGSQTWNAKNGPLVFNPFDASNANLRNINLDGGYYADTSKNAWYSTLTLRGNHDVTINNPIVGYGYLIKEDANTLILAGNNTYTPPRTGSPPFPSGSGNDYYFINPQEDLRVHGGTVKLTSTGFLPSTSRVFVANRSGATFDMSGLTRTIASLSGGGPQGGTVLVNGGSLTLGGAPITMSDHVPQTFRGTVALGASGTLTLNGWNSNVRQTLAGNITGGAVGSAVLTKNNAHFVTMGGHASFLGQVVVNEGRLQLASDNALGATGAGNETKVVGISGGVSGRLSFVTNGVISPEDFVLAYSHTSSSYTSTSLLTLDASDITATHNGTLILDRTSTGTGTTDFIVGSATGVSNSTLNLKDVTGANSGGVASGTTRVRFNAAEATSTVTQSGTVSKGNAVTMSMMMAGAGTKNIRGLNTYNGSSQISAGVVYFSGNSSDNIPGPFGQNANPVTFFDGGDANGSSASLLTDGPSSFAKTIQMSAPSGAGTGTATVGGGTAHLSTFSGQIRWNGNNLVLLRITAAAGGRVEIAGEIRDNGNTNATPVEKVGSGVVAFTRAAGNSYDGPTTVSAGTLLANNTSGSATGSGGVSVGSGARLGGTGLISGSVTMQSGATLVADLVTAPSSHDRLDLGSSLTLNATAIDLTSTTGQAASGTYVLLQAGSITGTLGPVTPPAGFVVTSAAIVGNQIQVTLNAATTPLENWRQQHFGSASNSGSAADTFDADGDGVSNLLEYALNTLPDSVTSRPNLEPQISGDKLQMSFLRARADVTYEVLASSDLAIWNVIATNPGTVGEEVTVIDSGSIDPRRFLRLRVSSP